ncbi:MAG: capsule biosynthesis protein [Rhodobacteraceae bacterium]|jgi:capsular polysaccharide transport system permease protein|nr:capsule biosynthesis protein [Paracoccaceae bacterium]
MTSKPRASRFRFRRAGGPGPGAGDGPPAAGPRPAEPVADALPFATGHDGFGPGPFATAGGPAATGAEGAPTARQLRLARRLALRHGIEAATDLEAVDRLRARGIDPFQHTSLLELVASDGRLAADAAEAGEAPIQLPQTRRPAPPPAVGQAPARPAPQARAEGILEIQRDIARRRRRRSLLLLARLAVFVFLPTLLAGYYYHVVATPLYATRSEFVIQQASPQGGAQLGGLFSGTAFASQQDSITVQSYLTSRDAMLRLDADHGFKAHFAQPAIDPIQRLDPAATNEDAYRLYQRNVRIGYDPTEGIIKMEVTAADPAVSAAFSRALIGYAEEVVDRLTQRLREDQMRGARSSYEEAEQRLIEAQRRVVELQEQYRMLSSEVEVGLLTAQITALETELTQQRLILEEMLANPNPNRARTEPIQRRIANLEREIATLRGRLTQDSDDGASVARVQGELLIAQADVQTRQMMLAQALQQLEAARIEAGRQVRYLSLGVSPVAPDAATYPRAFENTALAFLIFGGIYLMLSMTASILREQVSA